MKTITSRSHQVVNKDNPRKPPIQCPAGLFTLIVILLGVWLIRNWDAKRSPEQPPDPAPRSSCSGWSLDLSNIGS